MTNQELHKEFENIVNTVVPNGILSSIKDVYIRNRICNMLSYDDIYTIALKMFEKGYRVAQKEYKK